MWSACLQGVLLFYYVLGAFSSLCSGLRRSRPRLCWQNCLCSRARGFVCCSIAIRSNEVWLMGHGACRLLKAGVLLQAPDWDSACYLQPLAWITNVDIFYGIAIMLSAGSGRSELTLCHDSKAFLWIFMLWDWEQNATLKAFSSVNSPLLLVYEKPATLSLLWYLPWICAAARLLWSLLLNDTT